METVHVPVSGDESGGPSPENFKILDGRRCNRGIYLRKMKLLIGLKNAAFRGNMCSSQREIEEIHAAVKLPQNLNRLTMPWQTLSTVKNDDIFLCFATGTYSDILASW